MAPDEIIDRLYGLPLEEFTAARNEAARELRKAGQREAAEQVKALRKPTTAAGAVNRLVREHRDEVELFLRAAADLRDAQFSGKGDLAAANRQEQAALERLTSAGGEEVRQSLLAASVDDDAARRLLEARLVHELEPAGFGTLLAHVTPTGARLKPASATRGRRPARGPEPESQTAPEPESQAAPGRQRARQPAQARERQQAPAEKAKPERTAAAKTADDGAARSRLAEAKAALKAAEAEESQARRHWDQARREAEKARAAVERARRDLDRLHDEAD